MDVDVNMITGLIFIIFFLYLITRDTKPTKTEVINHKPTYKTVKKQKKAKQQQYLDLENDFRRYAPPKPKSDY